MKILILRFSSIGDIVLTTPVLRCLKKQIPGAEIHYLTKASYASLLDTLPYPDKVITFHQSIKEVIPLLRKEHYDHIIDLHKNLRTKILLLKLRRRAGTFPKLNIQKWLMVRFKINLLPPVHIVDRYFKAVKHVGITNDGAGLDFMIPEGTAIPKELFPLSSRDHYTVIVIGAKQFTKQIPAERIISLCRKINQPVVLLGGKDEMGKAEMMTGALNSANIINICGRLDLQQSALLMKGATNIITADTGMMHIAAALKKEVISVWGNTLPAFGMTPYYPKGLEHLSHIIENTELKCRPCTKLGFDECPKKHFKCMMDIPEQKILKLIK